MVLTPTPKLNVPGWNSAQVADALKPRVGYTANAIRSTSPAYSVGPTNFNDYMGQYNVPSFDSTQQGYQKLQGQANSLYDSSAYGNQINSLANYSLAAGMNAANAAARQYSSSAGRAGVSSSGAGVARALSMMPALQQASGLKLQGQEFAAAQNAAKAEYLSQLQNSLSAAQGDYRNMLAGYNQGMMGIQNQSAQWQAQLEEQQRQFDEQQKMMGMKMPISGGSSSGGGGMGLGGGAPDALFNPGYITNSGPLKGATYDGRPIGGGKTVYYSAMQPAGWRM